MIRLNHSNYLILLILSIWVGPAQAETAYVTDILRLGLHQAQDTSDRPFRTLVSGTELNVLQRVTNYARVRAPDGREGWVKAAYLVTEKPSRLRMVELETEVSELSEALSEASAKQEQAEADAARLRKEAAETTNSSAAIRERLATLTEQNDRFRSRLDSYRGSLPLSWVGIALIVTLGLGFLAGLWWIDYQSRRRHGGFRVY